MRALRPWLLVVLATGCKSPAMPAPVVEPPAWGQQGIRWPNDFRLMVSQDFGAQLFDVDFGRRTDDGRQRINSWVEKLTQGKVQDLIAVGRLGRDHRLVLTTALNFKGPWAARFDPARTRPAPFARADGTRVKVPMMHRTGGFRRRHVPGTGDDPAESVAVIPYTGDRASMIVFLPARPDGLPALMQLQTVDWASGGRESPDPAPSGDGRPPLAQ